MTVKEADTGCCEIMRVALETIQGDTGFVGIWEITGCVGAAYICGISTIYMYIVEDCDEDDTGP